MKAALIILCWLLTGYCIYFPYSYFHKNADKKEIKLSHILVSTEEKAQNIKNELNNKSFEDLAQQYSLCPSKELKGDIGYNTKENLLPEISNRIFNMNLQEISNPIKSEEGWHIVKIYDIKYYSDKENFERKYF